MNRAFRRKLLRGPKKRGMGYTRQPSSKRCTTQHGKVRGHTNNTHPLSQVNQSQTPILDKVENTEDRIKRELNDLGSWLSAEERAEVTAYVEANIDYDKHDLKDLLDMVETYLDENFVDEE